MLEYKVKIIKSSLGRVEKLEARYEQELNALAREGWRVVSVSAEMTWGGIVVTLEREVKNSMPSF